MQVYEKTTDAEGNIILTNVLIDTSLYTIIDTPTGKLLKLKKTINNIADLSKYSFTHSKIQKCNLDRIKLTELSYFRILQYIYDRITDGSQIIKNTILNIKTLPKSDNGFKYLGNIGISVQYADANKTLQEILTQCIDSTIKLEMMITLKDESEVFINI